MWEVRPTPLRTWTPPSPPPPPQPENCSDLLTLDSRDITDPAVIDTVRQIEKLGEEQYDA